MKGTIKKLLTASLWLLAGLLPGLAMNVAGFGQATFSTFDLLANGEWWLLTIFVLPVVMLALNLITIKWLKMLDKYMPWKNGIAAILQIAYVVLMPIFVYLATASGATTLDAFMSIYSISIYSYISIALLSGVILMAIWHFRYNTRKVKPQQTV